MSTVIIRVEIGEKQTTYLKAAPQLPAGVAWHPGVVFGLCDKEYVAVETVVVHENGAVLLWLEPVPAFDESRLIECGWQKLMAGGK